MSRPTAPWSAPVVMVPKKGGKLRFCVDYRGLKAVTRKDSYPLPRVDECLDMVRGSDWFSSLDLRSGYRVLERVTEAGLKLHPDKWHFMQREVTFLGHRIGGRGISTMSEKVEAVRDWPVPTAKTQVKSFLGLASYYRRFVRGFSSIASPLTSLLGKDREFIWTEECQKAFDSLKRALMEAP